MASLCARTTRPPNPSRVSSMPSHLRTKSSKTIIGSMDGVFANGDITKWNSTKRNVFKKNVLGAPNFSRKDRECFSDAFVRRPFTSSMYPGRTLVWYIGDENVVPKVLSQGNAKKSKTLARNFVPVPESTRIEFKESAQDAILSGKTAAHIHEEMLRSDDSRTHHRDLNQVQNFSRRRNDQVVFHRTHFGQFGCYTSRRNLFVTS